MAVKEIGKVLNMAGEVIDDGLRMAAKNTDDAAKMVIKNPKSMMKKGTTAVKRTAEESYERAFRQLELEESFGNAVKVGNNKNHVFVDAGSDVIGKYANELKNNPNNQKSALRNATKGAIDVESMEQRTLWKEGQKDLIENNRNHSDELRSKVEEISSRKTEIPTSEPKQTLNGSTPVTNAPKHNELKRSRYESPDAYMQYKQSLQYEEVMKAVEDKEFNNPLLKQLNINSATTADEIQALRSSSINSASRNDMGFTDMMGYHKVPQKVTGVAGTAWLVNKLAASNGQQTNSQLYGQAPY